MSYKSWFDSHAQKHKKIVNKLSACGNTQEEVIKYFEFENMLKEEPAFCPLYRENKKCHEIEYLNCYLCACPNFRFSDEGVEKVEEKIKYSFCAINSKDGKAGVYGDTIHQDCSNCRVPHAKSYVEAHFDLDWKKIMKDSPI
ncbi:MAG: hypothetical protein NTZ60_08950 [Campylobacterales bacterium]|nr:hypothetical protein [Campylobacterales bacterium]